MKTKIIITAFCLIILSSLIFSCKNTAPDAIEPDATATNTPQNTFTATRSDTATITATPTNEVVLDQHFDTTVEGWTLDPAQTGGVSISHNTASPYGAKGTTGCAKVTCAFTGSGGYNGTTSSLSIVYNFPAAVDLKNYIGVIYLYIPPALAALSTAGEYGMQVEFSTVNNSTFHAAVGCGMIAGWNGICTDTPADSNQTNAVRVHIWKESTSTTDLTGDIFLDEVYW